MKFNLIKKITATTLVFALLTSTVVNAETVKSLEQKQNDIENSIKQTNKKIDERKATLEDVNAEIDKLDKELNTAMQELSKINSDLDTVAAELKKANEDLVTATQEKENQQEALLKRVRYMYEYGDISYIDTLLDSKNFSDLINRVEYLNTIHEYDQNIYDSLEQKETEIKNLVETIDSKKKEVEVLQKSATQKRDELQANVSQKEALNKKIETDISLLEKQIEEEEQANRDVERMIQAEIKRQQEAAIKNSGGGINTKYTGGKLMWPSNTTTLSSPFGYRIHPITGKKKLHAGVDVPVSIGSSIFSAESGTVITSGWVQGYGSTVIIMHDNGLTTLYGHLSQPKVSVGQRVNRGDLIALSGNSGNSTGPHLHFEVRLNGTAVDPMAYVQ